MRKASTVARRTCSCLCAGYACRCPFQGPPDVPCPCPLPCSTTVFSHSQTVVVCPSCNTVLCVPTGGKARLTEGACQQQQQQQRQREAALAGIVRPGNSSRDSKQQVWQPAAADAIR